MISTNTDMHGTDVVDQKLTDLNVPGHQIEFTPDEADQAGAFVEDALPEADALDAAHDARDLAQNLTGKQG